MLGVLAASEVVCHLYACAVVLPNLHRLIGDMNPRFFAQKADVQHFFNCLSDSINFRLSAGLGAKLLKSATPAYWTAVLNDNHA